MSSKTIETNEPLSRRAFVMTGLAAGFALAAQPVSAQTITTDSKGLTAGEVKIKAPDGIEIPAYRAFPENFDNLPVILVVQEIFGVHEHIKDVCRRLAKRGYFAIAPELYARQGDVSKLEGFEQIRGIVSKVPDKQVMGDLDAAVAWAKATGKADTDKLGITGFCWGGRIVWLYAAHNPKVKAGVAWYGRLVGEPTDLQPKNPIDFAETLTTPILGLYAGEDRGITEESIVKMRAELKKGKTGSEIIVYPGAQHGFHADYRPSYNPEAAKDGFGRLLGWFYGHGVA